MKNKPKREPIPQDDVLAWLEEHHPALHGTHALPSGQAGNWSHSCEAPLGFRRKPRPPGQANHHQAESKARGKSATAFPPEDRFDPLAETETIEHEALAFALG